MELLERAAAAASPLLAAESIAEGGLLLTFEAGRLRLAGEPASAELVVELVAAGDLDALRRVNLGEEEPWWRLVGSPLVAVHAISGGAALQFRHDDDNPRVVEIVLEAGTLRVGLRPFDNAPS